MIPARQPPLTHNTLLILQALAQVDALRVDLEDALGAAVRAALDGGGDEGEPAGLGEALVAALSAAAASSSAAPGAAPSPSSPHLPLLPATVARCGLAPAIAAALRDGLVALDGVQRDYLQALLGGGGQVAGGAAPAPASPLPASAPPARAPDAATRASLAAAITDVLPHLGAGYAAACLAGCGWEPEAALARLLEGDPPPSVAGLDPATAVWEPPPPVVTAVADPKGKGKAPALPPGLAAAAGAAAARPAPSPPPPQPPAAVSHRSVARFLEGGGLPDGQRDALLAATRASIAAFQKEEEEGGLRGGGDSDDFDEEEDGVGGSGGGPTADGLFDGEGGAGPSSAGAPPSLPTSRRPTTHWVAGGKVYNYKKEGALAVTGGRAGLAAALDATAAAAQEVHGLGPGGNKGGGGGGPAVVPGPGRGGGGRTASGRGGSRGGGRGGGRGRGRGDAPAGPSDAGGADTQRMHAHAERHKAAAGNHHRRDRAAKKAGGGML